MELTKMEKQIVDSYAHASFESFWAKCHVSDKWQQRLWLILFYFPIFFIVYALEEVIQPLKWLGTILPMGLIFMVTQYQMGYVIKKLANRIKELENKN